MCLLADVNMDSDAVARIGRENSLGGWLDRILELEES